MQLFGGLDIGTNGVRLVVVNDGLEILYQNEINYQTNSPLEGRVEQDPLVIYRAACSLLEEAVISFKDDSLYITFSSVMHSIMGVDKQGNSLTPLIIWADTRAQDESTHLMRDYGNEYFYNKTACPLHSAYWPAKINWLRRQLNFEIEKYVSIKEFVIFKLTGSWLADRGIASTSGLYNPLIADYEESILEILKINSDNLSPLVETNYQFEFKIKGRTVGGIAGSTDGPLANLGSAALQDNSIVLTAGSSSAVRFISPDLIFDMQSRVWNYVLDQDYYVLGEATNGAGLLLNWLSAIFNYDSAAEMVRVNLAEFPYQKNNLFCVPTMMGERGPAYQEGIRGLFYGLSLNHGKKAMVISLYESIAFFLKMILEDVQRIIKVPKEMFILTGGLGTSPVFRQLLAYLLDNLYYLSAYQQSTALGSAMLAIKEIKKISYQQQLEILPAPAAIIIKKDRGFAQYLEEKYQKFLTLYKSMPSLMLETD